MGSGGCGVLARKGTGTSNKFIRLIPECVSHRICIAWVAAISKGGFFLVSVYLKDSVGMNTENKMVCEHVAATVRCLDGPCVLAGDWNMEPATLATSGFLGMIDATIVAPKLPTRNGLFRLFYCYK